MKIISVNAGSSSLKFKLFEMPETLVLCEGVLERITQPKGQFKIVINDRKVVQDISIPNHNVAVAKLLEQLLELNIVNSLKSISGVGHRVVHGGEMFSDSVEINDLVIKQIEDVSDLAPLHNPANLIGIREFMTHLPHAKQVAVFDTAFHQTMKQDTYMYSVPYEWYEKYGVRKYGFHGTSHKYVSKKAAEMIGKDYSAANIIVAHIGNGASVCAVEHGKSVDTSMGFTPLAGVPMGTRSGDIDLTIVEYIMKRTNKSIQEVMSILNKQSGVLGVSGISSDNRDLENKLNEGSSRAKLALEIQNSRIAETIAMYIARLKTVDAICFTAGIGENSPRIRAEVLKRLVIFGIKLNHVINDEVKGKEASISTVDSAINVLVIPTNEELVIAEDTYSLL